MIRKLFLLAVLFGTFAFGADRVYELRTYHCNEGKLETLKTRFRDHAVELLKKHHIIPIGYWIPQDPELSKNTLIYIVVHESREAAMKNWAEFQADPEWRKVAADSEKDGKLLTKVDRVFMDPADFSMMK